MCFSAQANKYSLDQIVQIVYNTFNKGEYEKTIELLDALEKRIPNLSDRKQEVQGLVEYWRGLTYVKLSEYDQAILHFEKALQYDYKAEGVNYEIAQAYYVSEKLVEARQQFRVSVKRGYKRAASLYYMAFISLQLRDFKKAATYFSAVDRLPDEEKKEVVQAARMQLADLYLSKVENKPNSFKQVEKVVIPQYEKALAWDENSNLAPEIREKIEKLQRKYDLVLFKMRNGRPTARPPYFLKANILYGSDNNVNLLDQETVAESDAKEVASNYYSVGTFGRYTYYPNSTFSFSPEFQFNMTRYLSDQEDIYATDNYGFTFGLKSTYEHVYNNTPATLYFDIEKTINNDDANSDKTFEKSYDQMSFTLSEEIQLWTNNPSIFRYRTLTNTNVEELYSFTTKSYIYEQLITLSNMTLYFYSAMDQTAYPEFEDLDTNATTFRLDFIFSTIFGLFNPSVFASKTDTTYVNNDSRGLTSLTSYGFNLNRPLSANTYLYLDFSQSNQTGELDSDIYTRQIISLSLDYFY